MNSRFSVSILAVVILLTVSANPLFAQAPPPVVQPATQLATPVLQRDDKGIVTITCATSSKS